MKKRISLTAKMLEHQYEQIVSQYFDGDYIKPTLWGERTHLQILDTYARLVCHNELVRELRRLKPRNKDFSKSIRIVNDERVERDNNPS